MISLINKIILLEILLIFYERNIFSDIYTNNLNLKYHIIISLTTSKDKMKYLLVDKLIESLLNQTIAPYKIILSINKIDINYASDFLKSLVNNEVIELVFVNEDLKDFNKYYYIPDEYKKYIIIVLDDNVVLETNAIKDLFNSYKLYPNAISARRVYKMNFNQKWTLKPFYFWDKDYKYEKNPKFSLFAIHGAGALFPPNFLNFTEDFIFYFKKAIYADDFIMKYIELKENKKTVYVNNNNKYGHLNIEFYEKFKNILDICPSESQLEEDFEEINNTNLYNNIIKEKVIIQNETKEFYLNTINKNKITNDTLLISMTSNPVSIYEISEVLISLLYQTEDIFSYQCFLTLAKEEFIKREKDLPEEIQKLVQNGWVKIIWYHNIHSHKRLIPILKIYPDNDILLIDNDIIRTRNFLEIFQKEHKLYPTDIICGTFMYNIDNNMEIKKLNGYKDKKSRVINAVPNIIFETAIPSNGIGGILYPKHTFSDERFFNESLFMNLSPLSDELWQYTFNIIENKIFRQTSIIIDNSVNIVKDNKKNYSLINTDFSYLFPEYKNKSLERQKKIIVSLTSYKPRLKTLNLVLNSIFENTMKPFKIILTLHKEDIKYLTADLKKLIANKSIELIVTDMNLKSHKKYFEVMKKYRDYAIITIDDDIIYTNDLIETLYNSYIKYPNCIHARRVHKIMTENNTALPYNKWLKEYTLELNPSFYLFPTSGGGTLFPPNILNISNYNIGEINKCLTADDIYIKYLSRKRNIKIVWVPNKFLVGKKQLNDTYTQKVALYNINVIGKRLNNIYLNIFPVI